MKNTFSKRENVFSGLRFGLRVQLLKNAGALYEDCRRRGTLDSWPSEVIWMAGIGSRHRVAAQSPEKKESQRRHGRKPPVFSDTALQATTWHESGMNRRRISRRTHLARLWRWRPVTDGARLVEGGRWQRWLLRVMAAAVTPKRGDGFSRDRKTMRMRTRALYMDARTCWLHQDARSAWLGRCHVRLESGSRRKTPLTSGPALSAKPRGREAGCWRTRVAGCMLGLGSAQKEEKGEGNQAGLRCGLRLLGWPA